MSQKQDAGVILVRKGDQSAGELPVDVDAIAIAIAERYPATSVIEARNIILELARHFGYSRRIDSVEDGSAASNVRSLRFAELLDADGRKMHVGCVMSFGKDWVEVSYPARAPLQSGIHLRFLPSHKVHKVDHKWRHDDRAGFTYQDVAPLDAPHVTDPDSLDPRSSAEKMRE